MCLKGLSPRHRLSGFVAPGAVDEGHWRQRVEQAGINAQKSFEVRNMNLHPKETVARGAPGKQFGDIIGR